MKSTVRSPDNPFTVIRSISELLKQSHSIDDDIESAPARESIQAPSPHGLCNKQVSLRIVNLQSTENLPERITLLGKVFAVKGILCLTLNGHAEGSNVH